MFQIVSKRMFSSSRIILQKEVSSLDPKKVNHMQYLLNYYDPEIVDSILKAETAIDPKHYENRKLNPIQFAPHFLTDFTKKSDYFDHQEQDPLDFTKISQPNEIDIPKNQILDVEGSKKRSELGELAKKLSLATGFDERYIMGLKVKTLLLKTVRNQTSKGKINSFYALVCAGDGNGMLGIGEGKDPEEPGTAILKAHWQAVKNLVKVPRLEDRTIFGNIEHKFGASVVHLRSAPPGSGLRCNPMIFELAQCAGIKDLSSKVYRSRNKMNVVKCTIEALLKQKTTEEMALERGKKVVDLRKVYYSVEKN
ncbi:mitochondrial 37S ribosomal protein [Pichia kluyveri]|uniref:Small ribosomal subunit protein uS5m n=1 Tax=Pichia kluyveri TaxID=36015 RepID=A0AAV5R103_PICKL|nr:mitochondrial 37S ribosomal protein [Pichia kluyveri]